MRGAIPRGLAIGEHTGRLTCCNGESVARCIHLQYAFQLTQALLPAANATSRSHHRKVLEPHLGIKMRGDGMARTRNVSHVSHAAMLSVA